MREAAPFPTQALLYADAFLRSGILPPGYYEKLIGADVLYSDEFLDIYGLLPAEKRGFFFPLLDEGYYRKQRPDLSMSHNALVDFFVYGIAHAIPPHPLIDLSYIRFLRQDLWEESETIAWQFWRLFSENLVDPSPFFSVDHYRGTVKGEAVSPAMLVDMLLRRDSTGCSIHPMIDIERYSQQYKDVPTDRFSALLHFITVGDAERRVSSDAFDPVWYSNEYAEGGKPLDRPLAHYLRLGRFARRSPKQFAVPAVPPNVQHSIGKQNRPERSSAIILRNYSKINDQIQERRSRRMNDLGERDIRPVVSDAHELLLARLVFPVHESPQIDVVIPCYQEFEKTVECLASIAKADVQVPLHIILADDCSPDPRYELFKRVPGLTYRRNPQNLHFLRSCNAAFLFSKAPFVLLLNNDAQVMGDTIDLLWRSMVDDPELSAASPKILYPNGRLQEAGCTIEADGETRMVGLFDDPELPIYQRDRDIAYGSGACLLVRRNRVPSDLFDERFAPAYCEDVDLCISLRSHGGRIRYVAAAQCVHHLSATTSAASHKRRVQLVRRNQQKLLDKWGDRLADDVTVRVLAFYLPQFHPVRENNLWWGKGFTEWTNVVKAQPSYVGHYQPHLPSDLGFYDLRLTETMEDQMALARRYGIHGFVMYYYNFQQQRVLNRPLDNILAAKIADFRFCLCWANENWTRHWDGGSTKHALMTQDYAQATYDTFADDAIAAARLSGYITINGLPLLMIYRPQIIPDVAKLCGYLRQRFAEAGFNGVYLAFVESMETANQGLNPRELGFDASVEFPPQGVAAPLENNRMLLKSGFVGKTYDYPGTVVNACSGVKAAGTHFPGVFPSWDNTPRQPLAHTTLEGALPERFRAYVEAKLDQAHQFLSGNERLVFVNAWNEWAEGAHLEPDHVFEHDWLCSIADALDARQFREK